MRQGKEVTRSVTLGRLEDSEKKNASLETGKESGTSDAVVQKALGMSFAGLSAETKRKYQIKDSVAAGVVVTDVEPNSAAAEKQIKVGEVIVEINQDTVKTPAEVAAKMAALKDGGKKSALLLIANAQGEVRFVALALP